MTSASTRDMTYNIESATLKCGVHGHVSGCMVVGGGGGTCPGHYMYWFLAAATGLDDAATV